MWKYFQVWKSTHSITSDSFRRIAQQQSNTIRPWTMAYYRIPVPSPSQFSASSTKIDTIMFAKGCSNCIQLLPLLVYRSQCALLKFVTTALSNYRWIASCLSCNFNSGEYFSYRFATEFTNLCRNSKIEQELIIDLQLASLTAYRWSDIARFQTAYCAQEYSFWRIYAGCRAYV